MIPAITGCAHNWSQPIGTVKSIKSHGDGFVIKVVRDPACTDEMWALALTVSEIYPVQEEDE